MKNKALGKSLTIAFLGPDGSGKSTVIDGLMEQELPFESTKYFHLKPILKSKASSRNNVVDNPHKDSPYGKLTSYIKLVYFIFQYNWGWYKNISSQKNSASLIIFDRYFDDMIADPKRYRYGGSKWALKMARKLIPRPKIYFILTTDAQVIHKRKQEVSISELERQIEEYQNLADNRSYLSIDVNHPPADIIEHIKKVIINNPREDY